MSSSGEVPHEVDPDYAALFRQSSSDVPPPAADPDDDPLDDPIDEALPENVPAPRDPMTDTGRLFRSQGVKGNDTAVLALSSVQGVRLRTLKRTDVEPEPIEPLIPDRAEEPTHQPPPAEPGSRSTARDSGRRKRRAASSLGLPARTCYLLIIGVTLLVAFVNAFLANGDIGWPTGIAMLAATVYCALKVRREDDVVPVITPPLAFFLTAITAAQLFLGSAERSLLNRAVVVFFTLANNWIWIIGATVVALVIMIVRRRRG